MQAGDVIDGKYRVDRQIGEGGMGLVLAVTHTKLGKKYAIKVVKPAAFLIPGVADRFLREARAASQLRSEHVGEVTDVGELPTGEPFMVMELLDGEDLGKIIDEEGALAPELAAEYILQACEALAEAHAVGMVHRDIKPANLFLTDSRDGGKLVKVLDFGIATAARGEVSGLTETHSVMGSPQYMSPEQLRSAKIVDARSDIWSLGVTLYELLSQRQPFDGDTFTALAIKIATEPHAPLVETLPALSTVVDRCLMKDPAKRFADISELAAALAPFSADGHRHAVRVGRMLRSEPASGVVSLSPADMVTMPGHAAPHAAPHTPHAASTLRDAAIPEHAKSSTTLGGSAASFVTMPEQSRRTRVRWIGAGVAIAAAITTIAILKISGGSKPTAVAAEAVPPAPPTPPAAPPTPAAKTSHVQIHTIPADAEIKLDGTVVHNPFDARLEAVSTRHHLEISARGYEPSSDWMSFEVDREQTVALTKEPTQAATKAATKLVPAIAKPTPPGTKPAVAVDPTAAAGSNSGSNTTYKGTKGSIITDYPTTP